jgi:glycosyltransferase involved in cell wall biosynthesis
VIVHQFVPNLEPGAVGTHTVLAREQLRAAGHTSDIYTAEVHADLQSVGARLVREYRGDADVIIYQMAIGSLVADAVLGRSEPLVVNHHNLTPMRYITGWQPVAAHGVVWGRAQLRELARQARLGVADSSFNEQDLHDAGLTRTTVVSPLFDLRARDWAHASPEPAERHGPTTWLFVGRLAPNKAQHDVIKALAAYRRFHDAAARLVLVGGGTDEPYAASLRKFVHALGLDDAVTFAGSVSDEARAAHYARADVFVVTSEHEGFCVPLVEAMFHRVPIVAFAAAAVPETLGDAGLLLETKDPCTVAAAVHRMLTDDAVRSHVVAAGATRAPFFDVRHTGPAFVAAVTSAAR